MDTSVMSREYPILFLLIWKLTKINGHKFINHVKNVIYFMTVSRIIFLIREIFLRGSKQRFFYFYKIFSFSVAFNGFESVLCGSKTLSCPIYLHMVCASSLQTMLFSYYLKSNDRAKKPKLPKPFLSFDLMCVFFSAFIYIQQHVRDTPYTYLRWNNHLTECEMHNFCALDFYHDHFIYGPVFRKFYTNELWIMALTVIAFKKQTLTFNRWRIHLRVHAHIAQPICKMKVD